MIGLTLLFVPLALLVLVATFYFVGCVLDTEGTGLGPLPPPLAFTTYSDSDVIPHPSCVHYWQLSDSDHTAIDVVGKANGNPQNGTYRSADTDPTLFPCPDADFAPNVHSAGAPGTQVIGAPGIVQGDTFPPHDPANPLLTKCMQVDGGFVEVPFSSDVNPSAPFTIEAWVLPGWSANDTPAYRVFIDSRNNAASGTDGYALWVNQDGNWEAVLNCTGNTTAVITAGPASLSDSTHVVLTFDGSNASLFINGKLESPVTPMPAGQTFSPNTSRPLVFGVGAPYLDPRTMPSDIIFFPFFPFKGKLQDIAIYNAVLSDSTIKIHSDHGHGKATEGG